MKREVERTKVMPAFSMTLGDLEELWNRLTKLFSPHAIRCSLEIQLPNEQLEFSDMTELKGYSSLPDKINSFSLYIFSDLSRVSIRAGMPNNSNMIVRATSDSEAWCAGSLETVNTYLNSHKKWYSWITTANLGLPLIIFGNIPTFFSLFIPKEIFTSNFIATWIILLLVIFIFYMNKDKLFPGSTILIRNNESFARKYSPEISIGIALLSVAIAIIGMFFKS